jgi:hypothetical protein
MIAAAAPPQPCGGWAYVAVFALMALSFAGIPALGAAVVGWASVLASQPDRAGSRVAIGAGCVVLAARYYRRRKARRLVGAPALARPAENGLTASAMRSGPVRDAAQCNAIDHE